MNNRERSILVLITIATFLAYALAATVAVSNSTKESGPLVLPTRINDQISELAAPEQNPQETDVMPVTNTTSNLTEQTPIAETFTILEQTDNASQTSEDWQPPLVLKSDNYISEAKTVIIPESPVVGQRIIRFLPDTTEDERLAYIASIGGTVIDKVDQIDTVIVALPDSDEMDSSLESPLIVSEEPDYYVGATINTPPSDPQYVNQWALPIIKVDVGWATVISNTEPVVVAVIDSGVCPDHPDMQSRTHSSWDFIEDDPVAQDEFGHGCAVAGIIAANTDNNIGIAGVAPNTLIMGLRVLDKSGVGVYSDVAAAIVYATDHDADIINLSLGGLFPSTILEDAVNYALGHDVLIVAAAGNTGSDAMTYPAAYQGVVSVGSIDPDLQTSAFSSFNTSIDLLAPGRDILTLSPDNTYEFLSGTSFAAPHVSGIAALKMAGNELLVLHGGVVSFADSEQPPDDEITPESTPIPLNIYYKVDPEVVDLLNNVGHADVIIAFSDPAALTASSLDRSAAVAQVQSGLLSALSSDDFVLAHQYSQVPALAGRISASALPILESDQNVAYVYIDEPTGAFGFESIPLIGADRVHSEYGLTGEGITVAVLDSGLDLNNPAIADAVIAQHCFSDQYAPTCPSDSGEDVFVAESSNASTQSSTMTHGTNVAAIITAPDGVAPDTNIVAIRVLDDRGGGDSSDYIAGLNWLVENYEALGVDVVNLSLGSLDLYLPGNESTKSCDSVQLAEATAVNLLVSRGVPVFVATGNQGHKEAISSPACTSAAISVAATYDSDLGREPDEEGTTFRTVAGPVWGQCFDETTSPDTVTCFSNVNRWTDIAAPGANIVIANTGFAGTSQASPHAAGTAALLLQHDPTLNAQQIEVFLSSTGKEVVDQANNVTLPRIDAFAAVSTLLGNPQDALCAPITQIPATECEALLDLYRSTNGRNWSYTTGWYDAFGNGVLAPPPPTNGLRQPCDGWWGVTCNADKSSVTGIRIYGASGTISTTLNKLPNLESLSISGNTLTGPIPSEIGELSNLQSLSLKSNQLTGTIPPELGNLSNLRVLSLSNNLLTGTIPSEIGNLTNLKTLNLAWNELTGAIPSTIGNLTQLDALQLSDNELSGPIPPDIGNLVNLTGFYAYNNKLNSAIPSSIGNLDNLQYLDLKNNRLSGPIPPEMGNLTNLTTMYLYQNQLTAIPPEIGNLTSLSTLYLYDNQLSSIPPEIGNLINIQSIYLQNNQLSGSIPPELGNMANLRVLRLYNNRLSGSIPPELGNLSNLYQLNLSNNQLTGNIPSELSNLSTLTYLDLSVNLLSGDIPLTFVWANFPNLTQYKLALNNLNMPEPGSPQEALLLLRNSNRLPEQIELDSITATASTPNTAMVTWESSSFTGYWGVNKSGFLIDIVRRDDQIVVQNIDIPNPDYGVVLERLVSGLDGGTDYQAIMRAYIQTDNNILIGTAQVVADFSTRESFCPGRVTQIPFEECYALEAIYLSLSGPTEWQGNWTGQFSNGWYEAFGNGISVPNIVPRQPCDGWQGITCNDDKTTITGLTLNYYPVGQIPPQVGNLTNLETLHIYGLSIDGPIPQEIGNLTNLRTLSLSGREISGTIPATLGNLNNLETLSLDDNKLTGPLPAALGNLSSLQLLRLSRNEIDGPIPPELGNLSNVTYMDLRGNQISGEIPPELGNLSAIETLDLGGNLLSGPIPPEIGNLPAITYLKLGYNYLSGPIPPELGNLPSIQFLQLYHNQLSGSIPPEIGNLGTLVELQLQYNYLSGSIPPELGNLSNLTYLGLHVNRLSDALPSELGNLANLRSLNLMRNRLTGELPVEFGNLSNLGYIILSQNQLSGPIPVSLASITGLNNIQLDQNQLSGPIPDAFGYMSNLDYLYLSYNRLTGEIPDSLLNLTGDTRLSIGLRYNGLWTTNQQLFEFIKLKDSYTFFTQTVPPSNLSIVDHYLDGFTLTWTPITYTAENGYYEVSCSPTSGGPYTSAGDISKTLDKFATGITIHGLEPGSTQYCVVTTTTINTGWYQDVMTSAPSEEFSVNVGVNAGSTNYQPADPVEVNEITNPDETFVIHADQMVTNALDDLATCDATGSAGRSVIFHGRSVIFHGTDDVGTSVIFSTEGSTVDTVLSVYLLREGEEISDATLRQIACNDDTNGETSSWVELKIVNGILYDADGLPVQVADNDSLVVIVEIRGIAEPTDKVILNVESQPYVDVTDTSEATEITDDDTIFVVEADLMVDGEFDDLSTCDATGAAGRSVIFHGRSVIFHGTSDIDRTFTFTTDGSTVDTVMSVYLLPESAELLPENLQQIACNDDVNGDTSSLIELTVKDGIIYDAEGNALGPVEGYELVIIVEIRGDVNTEDQVVFNLDTQDGSQVVDPTQPVEITTDVVYSVQADQTVANTYDTLGTCDATGDAGRSVIFHGRSVIFHGTDGIGTSVSFSTEGSTVDTVTSVHLLDETVPLEPENLQQIACNDNADGVFTSEVAIKIIDGVLYDDANNQIPLTDDDELVVIVETRGATDVTDQIVLFVTSEAIGDVTDATQPVHIETDVVYTVQADQTVPNTYDSVGTCDATGDAGRSVIFHGRSVIFHGDDNADTSITFSTEGSTVDTVTSVHLLDSQATLAPENLQQIACNDDADGALTSELTINIIDGIVYNDSNTPYVLGTDDSMIILVEIRGDVENTDKIVFNAESQRLSMVANTYPVTEITSSDIVYVSHPEYTDPNLEFDGQSSCDATGDAGRSVIFHGTVAMYDDTTAGGRTVIFGDTTNSTMDTVLTVYYLDGAYPFALENMVEVTCNDNNFSKDTSLVQTVIKNNAITLNDGSVLSVTPDDHIVFVAQTRGKPIVEDQLRVRIGQLDQTFDPDIVTEIHQPNSIFVTQPAFVDPKGNFDGQVSCDSGATASRSVVFQADIDVFSDTAGGGRSVIFGSTEGSSVDTVLSMYLYDDSDGTLPLTVANLVELACSDDSSQNIRDIGDVGDVTEVLESEGTTQPPLGSVAATSFTSIVFEAGQVYTEYGQSLSVSPDAKLIFVAQTRGSVTPDDKLRILIGSEMADWVINISRLDAFGLEAIYNSTDGDNWVNTLSGDRPWFTTGEPCGRDGVPPWFGITCDATQRVIAVDLPANGLKGSIPPQIEYLTSLTRLHIQNNMLVGEVPSTLTSLTQLGDLDIDYNALSASGVTATFVKQRDPNGMFTQTLPPTDILPSSITGNGFVLVWTPMVFTEFDGGYELHCGTDTSGPYVPSGVISDKLASEIALSGLLPETTYYCVVKGYTLPHSSQVNTLVSLPSPQVSITTAPLAGVNRVIGSEGVFEFDGTTQFPFTYIGNSRLLPRGDALISSCTPDGTVPLGGHSVVFRGTADIFSAATSGERSILIGEAGDDKCISILSENNGIFIEEAVTIENVAATSILGRSAAQAEIVDGQVYYIQFLIIQEGDVSLTTDVRSNYEPSTTPIDDIIVLEDSPITMINVYAAFSDQEDSDDILVYAITNSNPDLVSIGDIDALTGQMSLTYAPNGYGEASISIRATDTSGQFAELGFNVIVESVNDTPVALAPAEIVVTENDPDTIIDLYSIFSDIEDSVAELDYSIISVTDPALFASTDINFETGQLALSYAQNQHGNSILTIRATDSEGSHVDTSLSVVVKPLRTTGSIAIVVDAVPDSGRDWNFDGTLGSFVLDDDDTLDASTVPNKVVYLELQPGIYTISEANVIEPSSWDIYDINCHLLDGTPIESIDFAQVTASIPLEAADDVTCVFTNHRLGGLIVTAFNDLDGDGISDKKEPTMPDLTIELYATGATEQLIFTDITDKLGRVRTRGLHVGEYRLCEILPAEWWPTSPIAGSTCQLVEIQPGKTTRATFGNAPENLGALSAEIGPRVIDSNDPLVDGFGDWQLIDAQPDTSNGVYLTNTASSDYLVLQFEGTAIEIEYLGGPEFGDFQIELDGAAVGTVSTYMEDITTGLSVIASNLSETHHVLRIMPIDYSQIAIDTFVATVDQTEGVVPSPTPIIIPTTMSTPTPMVTATDTVEPIATDDITATEEMLPTGEETMPVETPTPTISPTAFVTGTETPTIISTVEPSLAPTIEVTVTAIPTIELSPSPQGITPTPTGEPDGG